MNPRSLALGGIGFGPLATATLGAISAGSNLRAVAVQGVGFGPRLTALQGFGSVDVELPIPVKTRPGRSAPARRRNRDDEALLFMLLR